MATAIERVTILKAVYREIDKSVWSWKGEDYIGKHRAIISSCHFLSFSSILIVLVKAPETFHPENKLFLHQESFETFESFLEWIETVENC